MSSENGGTVEGSATTEQARLAERLAAVERAIAGDERTADGNVDGGSVGGEPEAVHDRLDEIEARVEELEAATQAVRGYAGAIRAVNRDVERRADLALARATETRGTSVDRHGDSRRADGNGADIPTDGAIEAAIPGDDPATTVTRRPETGGCGRGNDTADGDERGGSGATGAFERLRDAL